MTEEEIDGCHIMITDLLLSSWSVKKYIISGHYGCNMRQDEEFDAKITIKVVEAIEK